MPRGVVCDRDCDENDDEDQNYGSKLINTGRNREIFINKHAHIHMYIHMCVEFAFICR